MVLSLLPDRFCTPPCTNGGLEATSLRMPISKPRTQGPDTLLSHPACIYLPSQTQPLTMA